MCCKGLTLGLGMYEWTRRSTPPRRAWSSNQSRVLWTDHQILCRFGQISTVHIHREISDRVRVEPTIRAKRPSPLSDLVRLYPSRASYPGQADP